MGLCNSADIFQEKMNKLFAGLEYIRAYIDDLLIISKGSFEDHLDKLEQVLNKLKAAGLKRTASKSYFAQEELEYLGYWITREGILPIKKKNSAMLKISKPTTRKQLRKFIGMVNYYCDMWRKRSEVLEPLTDLTSTTTLWKWKGTHNKAFHTIKKIISRETLLAYPDFSRSFKIHTDASDYHLGAVISQNKKTIVFTVAI